MYIQRVIEELLKKAADNFACITIYGPRQVGKSTTANKVFGQAFTQVNLDNFEDRNLAIQNPTLFLDIHPYPLIIDEIQRAPMLLEAIKERIDKVKMKNLFENKKQQLMYVLNSSSRFELLKGISESLAGRTALIEMPYLSMTELLGLPSHPFTTDIQQLQNRFNEIQTQDRRPVFDFIFNGFMPDVNIHTTERNLYYSSYINTYIEKDVRNLISVKNESVFRDFIRLLAYRSGQQISYADLAGKLQVDAKTIKYWVSLLVSSGICLLLHPYMSSLSNQIIKTPKIYFLDTGLLASLCGWQNAAMIENSTMAGAFFETFVVAEIVKNLRNYNYNADDHLFYYRDTNQKEVDLLFVSQNKIFPVEIKKNIWPNSPTKNWNVLKKYNMEILPGLVINQSNEMRPINKIATSFPAKFIGI